MGNFAKALAIIIAFIFMINLTGCSKSETNTAQNENASVTPSNNPENEDGDSSDVTEEEQNNGNESTADNSNKEGFNYLLENEENNQFNINRGGFVVKFGNFYYYSDEEMGLLYKVKVDGTDRIKVDNDPYVEYINIADGCIYYTVNIYDWSNSEETKTTTLNKSSAKIVKYSISTGMKTISNVHADKMIIDKSDIYFTNIKDKNTLYKTDLNFKKPIKIANNINIYSFYISNGFVYYHDNEGIWKVKNDGTGKTLEVESKIIENFTIYNGSVYYYTNGDGLAYSFPENKPKEKKLLLRGVTDLFIKDNYIYFKDKKQNLKVAKIDSISTSTYNFKNRLGEFTILGNVMFTNKSGSDAIKIHGYGFKERIDINGGTVGIYDGGKELKIGLDKNLIQDYVMLNVDIEDRNKIMLGINNELNKYFVGNSAVYFKQLIDFNNDKLNELIIIYKQFNSDESTFINGINSYGAAQCPMITIKWNGKNLEISEPYQLRNANSMLSNNILRPFVRLIDVEKGGPSEIVFDMGYKKIKYLEIFKVLPDNLEKLDAKAYGEILVPLGYK